MTQEEHEDDFYMSAHDRELLEENKEDDKQFAKWIEEKEELLCRERVRARVHAILRSKALHRRAPGQSKK